MIGEAIDTVLALGWALTVWIVLLALTVTAALYAAVTLTLLAARALRRAAVWARKGPRKAVKAPLAPEHASQASAFHPRPKRRPTPSWAHTQPLDHKDAA